MTTTDTDQHARSVRRVERGGDAGQRGKPGPRSAKRRRLRLAAIGGLLAAASAGAAWTSPWWLPYAERVVGAAPSTEGPEGQPHGVEGADAHTGNGHAAVSHPGHDEATSLELSPQGRKNIGLTLANVELRPFKREISIPAAFVDRPGRTEIAVSAPMTGIVTRIYPIRGEAVTPGDPLFDLRLTHEDLVEKQSSLLQSLEELDVVNREIERLREVTRSGAVAGKQLLQREYERQKIEAAIRAQKQALLLHGLSQPQVQGIDEDRRLLPKLTIAAPPMADCQSCGDHTELLQVAELPVKLGEHVTAGARLATLTDHCELYIEGKAFEQDADALNQAANEGVEITAIVQSNGSGDHEVSGLHILYVENQVERDSRALKFYVRLPNKLVRNEWTPDGTPFAWWRYRRFIAWRYRPGQRVEVLVPVERWAKQIVLPAEAVVREGAEAYVYQEIKGHFDRKPVHVQYRDQRFAVIESDGTLFPGDRVAAKGAYQIHLDLKKKAGGGPDPHAGHHH